MSETVVAARLDSIGCRLLEECHALGPLEREGVWRALLTPCGDAEREGARLRIRDALDAGDTSWRLPCEPGRLAAIRRALDKMPWSAWEALNAAVFELSRGNVFDDKVVPLEGGGIRHEFGQGPRWEQFLAFVESEREAIVASRNARGEHDFRATLVDVLDVGCWQGTLVCELIQRGFLATGIDVADGTSAAVDAKVALFDIDHRLGYHGCHTGPAHEVLPDLARYGFHYDLVCCQETLEHVPTRFLQATCDGILEVARDSILLTVPGWDDGWPAHLRIFAEDDFRRLFHADRHEVEILVPPGGGVYTTVRVRK